MKKLALLFFAFLPLVFLSCDNGFDEWEENYESKGDFDSRNKKRNEKIKEDIEKNVEKSTLSVSVASGCEGMGSVSGGGSFAVGDVATISAAASEGYVFVQWSDGNYIDHKHFLEKK